MKKFSHVWLIDDDEICIFLYVKQLKKHNAEIITSSFCNGEEFIHSLDKRTDLPELILLDINMPLMNGWEVLEELSKQERTHDFKIVIMSSSTLLAEKAFSKNYSMVIDHIEKPLTVEKIEKLLIRYNELDG